MNSSAIPLLDNRVPWIGRVRGLFTGLGYAVTLVLLLNLGWLLQDSLEDIGTVSPGTAFRHAMSNAARFHWPPLPSVLLVVMGVNLAPRAGVRRVAWLLFLALVITIWDHLANDPAFHEPGWAAHMLMHLATIALLVTVCAYHSNIQSTADTLLQTQIGRATLEAERKFAYLQLLRAQIEPHFLFNTLSAVRALARTDRAATVEMLDNLIRYFDAALPRLRQDQALLRDEMQLIDAYLAIYRVRMGARLAYEIALPEDVAQIRVPAMMLLTLVENAIKHGLNPTIEGGFIRVSASREGNSLLMKVADSGRGMSIRQGHGVGLANVRQRLILQYGAAAHLSLSRGEGRGVVATIAIPCADTP